MEIFLEWTEFKTRITGKDHLRFVDRDTFYKCNYGDFETTILKDSGDDQTDFETNYKNLANKSFISEVLTQSEMQNRALKCVSAKAIVDESGWAEVLMKVPGTFSGFAMSSHGRIVVGGHGWFDSKHIDDRVVELEVVDVDNILGSGANAVIRIYCDDEAGADNEGWFIPYHTGIVDITFMGGAAFLPSGLYLKIKAKKGGSIVTGAFYCNIKWGQLD